MHVITCKHMHAHKPQHVYGSRRTASTMCILGITTSWTEGLVVSPSTQGTITQHPESVLLFSQIWPPTQHSTDEITEVIKANCNVRPSTPVCRQYKNSNRLSCYHDLSFLLW